MRAGNLKETIELLRVETVISPISGARKPKEVAFKRFKAEVRPMQGNDTTEAGKAKETVKIKVISRPIKGIKSNMFIKWNGDRYNIIPPIQTKYRTQQEFLAVLVNV